MSFSSEANQHQQYFPQAQAASGWNDPPLSIVGNGNGSQLPSQFSSQRRRRPLDPSIQQDNANGYSSPNHGSTAFGLSSSQPSFVSQQQQPYQQQSVNLNYTQQQQPTTPSVGNFAPAQPYSTPQQHTQPQPNFTPHNPQTIPRQEVNIQPVFTPQQFITHPASAFTPMVPGSGQLAQTPQQLVQPEPAPAPLNNPNFSSAAPLPPPPPLLHPVVTGQPTAMGNPQIEFAGQTQHQPAILEHFDHTHQAPPQTFTPQYHQQQQSQINTPVRQAHPMVPLKGYEEDQTLIFSPPNTINFDQKRPATQPDPSTYVPPIKAAGDVSLNGPQLVNFLIKATIRLSEGSMREGIQLKIGQLNELVMAGQLSGARMFISQQLKKQVVNLNKPHWDRRVWETGYRGPLLARNKALRPNLPLKQSSVAELQDAMKREYNVMRWLANPYLGEEKERPYVAMHGSIVDQWKLLTIAQKQSKMPSKGKRYTVDGRLEKRRANVGNLLQSHRTIEDSMKELIRRDRWD